MIVLSRINTLAQAHITGYLEDGPQFERIQWEVRHLYAGGVTCTLKQTRIQEDGEERTRLQLTLAIAMVDATANAVHLAQERIRKIVDGVAKQDPTQLAFDVVFEGEVLPEDLAEPGLDFATAPVREENPSPAEPHQFTGAPPERVGDDSELSPKDRARIRRQIAGRAKGEDSEESPVVV